MPFSFRVRSLAYALCLLPLPAFACGGSAHIELVDAGVYRVAAEDILSRQPQLQGCPIDSLSLSNQGQPVPLRVVDQGDGRFGAGDHLEWVGKPLHGPMSWFDSYSIHNTYLLSSNADEAVRFRDLAAEGEGRASLRRALHLEQENLMIRLDTQLHKPGTEPDVWQWGKLTQADPQRFSTEFDLSDLASDGGGVDVRLNFRGISTVRAPYKHKDMTFIEHVVEIRLNDRLLETASWDGREEVTRTLRVDARQLREKGNVLSLHVPKRALPWETTQTAVDVVMFNWLEMDYPLRGHSGPGQPSMQVAGAGKHAIELAWKGDSTPVLYGEDGVRRVGMPIGKGLFRFASAAQGTTLYPVDADGFAKPTLIRAVATRDWHKPDQGYDYLIVSHASLIESIKPLAEFHERQGRRVAIIDVDEVYDAFNHGITHPRAIRNLVATAWKDWPEPRLRFLLLVGDASFDIRHDTYNDLAYAKFANSPQELVPGHFSGIPATSYAEVGPNLGSRNLIPTWQYPSSEGQSASDNWYGAVNDNEFHPVVAVGRFPVVKPEEVKAIVDKTIHYLSNPQPGSWRRDVMFITDESDFFKRNSDQIAASIAEQGYLAEKIYASPDEANNLAHQSAIKDGLNQGQLLVHFIGHGGRYIWRTGPPDLRKNHDLFTLDDVSQLDNGERLPMVLSMTCYSAPFDNPTEDSIGERFLREADKGAVAVFAASWRNSPSVTFSKALVRELLTPGASIGEAIVRAKGEIQDRTLVEMYNLLGDPAIVLERPRQQARVMATHARWNPGIAIRLPGQSFNGAIEIDWMDKERNVIARSSHHAESTLVTINVPRLGPGKRAYHANVYATDTLSGVDAFGGADLQPDFVLPGPLDRFKRWFRDVTTPPAPPDTLLRGYFEPAPDPAHP